LENEKINVNIIYDSGGPEGRKQMNETKNNSEWWIENVLCSYYIT
jgi:hypothetical protein